MTSDESPGSPRKKVKLELPTSIDAEMDSGTHSPEDMNNISHNDASHEMNGSAQDVLEAPQAPPSSQLDNIAKPPTPTGQANMATAVIIEPELSQLEKERACGITEFVDPYSMGFTGTLKKRYTDFIVNEILPSGKVVHLTNLKAPKKPPSKQENAEKALPTANNDESLKKIHHSEKASVQDEKPPGASNGAAAVENVSPVVSNKIDPAMAKSTEQASTFHQPLIAAQQASESSPNSSPKSSPITSPEKDKRTRQKFYIRHTNDGWVEFDKTKEDEEQLRKAAGSTSNVTALEEAFTSNASGKETIQSENDGTKATTASEPRTTYTPQASSAAQWQAYAKPNSESTVLSKISDDDKTTLLSYFSEAVVDAILSLYTRVLKSPGRSTRDYGTVKSAVIDRQLRTKIHQDIRRIFQSQLETVTDKDGAMIVSAMPPATNSYQNGPRAGHTERGKPGGGQSYQNGSRGQHSRAFGKPNWEELGGQYLHFTLYKENKDTMECILWLSKALKLGPKAFEFAGTKDRRAISAQRVSVYRQTIARMIDAGKTLRQASIGDYEYRPHGLQLGELTGNEFTITLRDCQIAAPNSTTTNDYNQMHAIVGDAMKNLTERGFINYYGLQRFGSFSTSTSDIGVRLLQGDFKSAADGILHFTPASLAAASQNAKPEDDRMSRDDKARAQAIHAFQTTGNLHKALADLPRKFSAESAIIRHLGNSKVNQGRDYVGAILSIQRNLRLMYVHAYQSLVWNMAASKRWSLYGDTVVDGDLVFVDEHQNKESLPKQQEMDEDGDPIIQPATEDRATNFEDLIRRARVLSKEEAESGRYTIFDIVLPTPGFDILYPANEISKFYEDFMASPTGGGLNPHDMRRPQKDFSMSGSYRKLIAKPGNNSSFEIKPYENENEQFVETDIDRMNKTNNKFHSTHNNKNSSIKGNATGNTMGEVEENAPEKAEQGKEGAYEKHTTGDSGPLSPESEDNSEIGGGVSLSKAKNERIALVLKLQLGTSQYATMALRELMKANGVQTYKPDFGGGR